MWMESAPHRANILHQLYREMGIGVAPNSSDTFVYVIDFGAQPNVLPIFINDGATETKSLDVKITLTSEEVTPNGDGDNIGRPVQMMISNASELAGAQWQPFAPTINWTLAPNGGTKTVYVKYRDAKGRTATASASIVFGTATTPTLTPTRITPTLTPPRVTPRPSAITLPMQTETPTALSGVEGTTATPTVAATDIAPIETPTATVVITASVTETAMLTPILTAASGSGGTDTAPNFAVLGAFGMTVVLIVFSAVKDGMNR